MRILRWESSATAMAVPYQQHGPLERGRRNAYSANSSARMHGYIADSDSEDVAAAIREDGLEANEEGEDDPVCPTIKFSAAEERRYCRELRSALVVKVFGRLSSYTLVSCTLNAIWAKAGTI
ncbi:unnamed protein product [Linum trigynum]|uniref:Uncharacterized protein n=1 Tax=Linum trigynum TaxID=586398 RepID=A0AAV2D9H5_9ROSI